MKKNFTWHKLTEKNKYILKNMPALTFIPAVTNVSQVRLAEIIKEYGSEGNVVVIGSLMDEWIPGLEDSPQFKPQQLSELELSLEKLAPKSNIIVLEYLFAHTKYIIRELSFKKVVWINGTWNHALHLQPSYWEAINSGAKVSEISPFMSSAEAEKYGNVLQKQNIEIFIKQIAQIQKERISAKSDHTKMFIEIAYLASRLSWDWDGQTGAVLAKGDQLISWGYNRVLPYEAAQMHVGSMRSKHFAEVGGNLEFGHTNHAEPNVILQAYNSQEKLEDLDLYTSKFPCPFCARIIADSPIKKIYYSGEYANDLGYKILQDSGKKLEKVVL